LTEIMAQEMTGNTMLPNSWQWARIEQLGDVITGNTPSTKERQYYGGSIPLFKPTDLNAGYWVSKSESTLTAAGAEKARVLPAKSILVTCIGATIGKTGLSQVEGATNQQINSLVPSKGHVVSEYLYFAFISRLMQDQVLRNASSTTLPILNKSKFSALKIPLPPLNEQHRIVEKIEELFTKLDAGVQALKQTQALLKSYRRSVLKAAVGGN
jgi:type I restriction enzyme, S subunit